MEVFLKLYLAVLIFVAAMSGVGDLFALLDVKNWFFKYHFAFRTQKPCYHLDIVLLVTIIMGGIYMNDISAGYGVVDFARRRLFYYALFSAAAVPHACQWLLSLLCAYKYSNGNDGASDNHLTAEENGKIYMNFVSFSKSVLLQIVAIMLLGFFVYGSFVHGLSSPAPEFSDIIIWLLIVAASIIVMICNLTACYNLCLWNFMNYAVKHNAPEGCPDLPALGRLIFKPHVYASLLLLFLCLVFVLS
jgi:hypothetical protein